MTSTRLTRFFAALITGAALTAGAVAQTNTELTPGEVRKVDRPGRSPSSTATSRTWTCPP